MTQSPVPGRAQPHLDDAIESAIADLLAGRGAPLAGTGPNDVGPAVARRPAADRAANGRPGDPSALAAVEAQALLPIAAALQTAPPLDAARRAALGALLTRIASSPDGDDGPPAATAASPARTADPLAVPPAAPGRNGIRPAGAAAIVGLLALLALGGAFWRGRGGAGGPESRGGSTASSAGSGDVRSVAPLGDTRSSTEDASAIDAPSHMATPAARSDVNATQAAARATSLFGMPSLGYTAAAATATARTLARSRALADAGVTDDADVTDDAALAALPDEAATAAAAGHGSSNVQAPTVAAPTHAFAADPTARPERKPNATQRPAEPPTASSEPPTVPPTAQPTVPIVPSHPCAAMVQPNVLVARIADEDGAPIVDAVVTLFLVGGIDFASFGASDISGCVAIEQAPGLYELRAEAAGFDARWYPDAADRAAAQAIEVDGAAGRAPVDVRLPRRSATAPPTEATAPPAPLGASPTAAEPTTAPSPTAAAQASGGQDAFGPAAVAPAAIAPAAAVTGLSPDRQQQLDGLAEFVQDGGTVTAVALDGHVVWGVVGPRVVGWPRSAVDGVTTAPVAWTPVLPEVPEAIAIDGDRLVVATPGLDGAPATIWIFDTAATGRSGTIDAPDTAALPPPAALPALGACDLTRSGAATVMALAADDTWVYALTEHGLSIIDAKRAAAPVEVGQAAAGTAPTARAAGSLALIGDGSHVLIARPSGLQVIDVRAPTAPRVAFQGVPRDLHAVGADAGSVAVAVEAVTGRLAAGGGVLRLTTLDVSDPTRPVALAAVVLPDGTGTTADGARAVTALAGTQGAVVDGDGRSLWLIDLTDPAAPAAGRRIALAPAPTGAAAVAMDPDGTAAVALGAAGIRLLADDLTTLPGVVPPVAQLAPGADGRVGWGAAGAVGLVAVDLTRRDGAAPGGSLLGVAAAVAPDGSAADVHSVRTVADTVYALTRRGGLVAFDGTDPRRPTQRTLADGRLAAIDGGTVSVQLAADGGRLFVPDAAGAVHVIDVARPADPRAVGRLADVGGGDDDRLVALAADGAHLVALTSDGRSSRLHAIDVRDAAHPRRVSAAVPLGQDYRHVALSREHIVLSGGRLAPGLGTIDRSLDPATQIEVPGFASGGVGLVDVPGGGQRALVADDAFLTAIDLDALADDARRVSGRSVRLPLGRRAAGGSTDVRIVGDRVFVVRHEAGLFARPHGGVLLPTGPSAAPPVTGGPPVMRHRVFLPSVARGYPACAQPVRVHGVLLVDAAAAAFAGGGVPSGADGDPALARFRPAISAWLGALGVGARTGTGASIVLWGEQANFVGQGVDADALVAAFPGSVVPRPGRRIELALKSAEQQLGVRAGAASADIAGRVVVVAAADWPDAVHARAHADAVRLRAAGWRIEAVALGHQAPVERLAELVGDASGVARAATLAELADAMAAAGRAAWRCAR